MRRLVAGLVALGAAAVLVPRATNGADAAVLLEQAWGTMRAITPLVEGAPFVVKGDNASVVSFVLAAKALAKEGSAKSANTLIEKLDDKLDNIYVDHLAHFAIRTALADLPQGSKGESELKRRLKGDRDWTKQVALAWTTRKRGPDAEIDGILRSMAKGASKAPVKIAAMKALGVRQCLPAVEDLLDIMESNESEKGRLWFDARLALHLATGYDRDSAKAWRAFWKEKGKGFDPERSRGNDARFEPELGVYVPGDRIVIAIDTSGSLHIRDAAPDYKGEPQTTQTTCPDCKRVHGPGSAMAPAERERIVRAKDACTRILKSMRPKAKFNLVRFDTKVIPWQTKGSVIAAAPFAIQSAQDYLLPLKPTGSTRMTPALDIAFATEDLDLLYLITDGAPTAETTVNSTDEIAIDEVIARARVLNRFREVRIFGVGFRQQPSPLLEVMTKEHGGTVTYLE